MASLLLHQVIQPMDMMMYIGAAKKEINIISVAEQSQVLLGVDILFGLVIQIVRVDLNIYILTSVLNIMVLFI